jgi:hypothetical protein
MGIKSHEKPDDKTARIPVIDREAQVLYRNVGNFIALFFAACFGLAVTLAPLAMLINLLMNPPKGYAPQ